MVFKWITHHMKLRKERDLVGPKYTPFNPIVAIGSNPLDTLIKRRTKADKYCVVRLNARVVKTEHYWGLYNRKYRTVLEICGRTERIVDKDLYEAAQENNIEVLPCLVRGEEHVVGILIPLING